MQTFTHGSEDSLDHDTYVIFDHIPTFKEAKSFCTSKTEDNANILVIEDGKVTWCFKGIEDECNNSLLMTYGLHDQEFPCPIFETVKRNVDVKVIRTVRGLLSYFSRTEHRIEIKKALRSTDSDLKMDTLDLCQLSLDVDFKKASHIEVFKFFAFQMGQTKALIEGVELFSKSSVAERYPELTPYLYRENINAIAIDSFFQSFKLELRTYIDSMIDSVQVFEEDKISKFI